MTIIALSLWISCLLLSNDSPPAGTASPALQHARAYLAACEKSDRDALDGLFLDKGRASVFENASDEGNWEHYRDHHLWPELQELKGIRFVLESEAEQVFGETTIVRHLGWFSVPDPSSATESRRILSAVTYVIIVEDGKPKIAHLHWSSRAARRPASQPSR